MVHGVQWREMLGEMLPIVGLGVGKVVGTYVVAFNCGVYKEVIKGEQGYFYKFFTHHSPTVVDRCWGANTQVIIAGMFIGMAAGYVFKRVICDRRAHNQ